MAYYRNGSRRGGGASLKPPAELVNEQVEWTPKDAVGRRGSRQIGRVISSMFRAEPWTSRYLRR